MASVYKYEPQIMTIGEFHKISDTIDCDPIHQRLERKKSKTIKNSNATKEQGIIDSVHSGMGLGTITIHKMLKNSKFAYESIDGGHRKRAIIRYLSNKFPVNGKFFRELTNANRDKFFAFKLVFDIYEHLTGPQVGALFRKINSIDLVNHQENLNSYGNTPIANAIRDMVRYTDHPDFHEVFSTLNGKPEHLGFDNEGLYQEAWLTRRFYYHIYGDGDLQCTEKNTQEMFDKNPSQSIVDKAKKKVVAECDFLLKMIFHRNTVVVGNTSKNGKKHRNIDMQGTNMFVRLYDYLNRTYGKFRFADADAERSFFKDVWKTHLYLGDKNTEDKMLTKPSPHSSDKFVWSQYSSSLNEYKSAHIVLMYPIDLLLERVDVEKFLIILQKKRTLTAKEREVQHAKQDFADDLSRKEMPLSELQAGHDVPYSKGGKIENVRMINTADNRAMGQIPLSDYKRYKEKLVDNKS